MKKSGVILELNNEEALVVTSESRFITIKRNSDMFVGQEISFNPYEEFISRYKIPGLISAAAGIAALLVIALISYVFLPSQSNVYAYIDVDINPSVEFCIDEAYTVLDTRHLNKDAKVLLSNLRLNGMHINKALSVLVKKSKEYGFIKSKSDKLVYVSASLNNQSTKFKHDPNDQGNKIGALLEDIKKNINSTLDESIEVEVIKVSPENRKLAQKNNISMGKYSILSEALKDGIDISVEEVKENTISETIRKVGEKQLEKNKITESNHNYASAERANSTTKAPSTHQDTSTGTSAAVGSTPSVFIDQEAEKSGTVQTPETSISTPVPTFNVKQTPGILSPVVSEVPQRETSQNTGGSDRLTHIPGEVEGNRPGGKGPPFATPSKPPAASSPDMALELTPTPTASPSKSPGYSPAITPAGENTPPPKDEDPQRDRGNGDTGSDSGGEDNDKPDNIPPDITIPDDKIPQAPPGNRPNNLSDAVQ
ncbi:MAG: anti-sigma-I factor RsgI family protein [Bacillota bacterium]